MSNTNTCQDALWKLARADIEIEILASTQDGLEGVQKCIKAVKKSVRITMLMRAMESRGIEFDPAKYSMILDGVPGAPLADEGASEPDASEPQPVILGFRVKAGLSTEAREILERNGFVVKLSPDGGNDARIELDANPAKFLAL